MFRTRSRRHRVSAAAIVGAALLATALTGCGAGQISQTANQSSAVNGGSANLGKLALRNVRLIGSPDPVQQRVGQQVELALVISNESPDVNDTLKSISSPDNIGDITLGGSTEVPAIGRLVIGASDVQEPVEAAPAQPQGQISIEGVRVKHGQAALLPTKNLADGLTYRFTFSFEKAGDVTVTVPIDAGPKMPRQDTGAADGGEH